MSQSKPRRRRRGGRKTGGAAVNSAGGVVSANSNVAVPAADENETGDDAASAFGVGTETSVSEIQTAAQCSNERGAASSSPAAFGEKTDGVVAGAVRDNKPRGSRRPSGRTSEDRDSSDAAAVATRTAAEQKTPAEADAADPHIENAAAFAEFIADSEFAGFNLSLDTLRSLFDLGYHTPSPIQAEFIPLAMTGRDCIGQARTGTGKTAAFILPILEKLDAAGTELEALILAPTRELSLQVRREALRLSQHHNWEIVALVGGHPIHKQITALRKAPRIAVGTPGRVIDLLRRGELKLDRLKFVVLDEADRMLDIGFRPDIERILRQCPTERQTLLLSATMPPPVERLARRYMKNPAMVDLSEDSIAVDSIRQFYITVDEERKPAVLARLLIEQRPTQAIVFTRTKRGAERLYQRFSRRLPKVAHMHGDLPQGQRDRALRAFRDGEVRLLIATDVVGRGIDVSGISHIINYDIPEFQDDYVHRIGRTGRLSSDVPGCAFTLVTREQGEELTRIEKRVNCLLEEYRVQGVEAYAPPPPRKTVEDA